MKIKLFALLVITYADNKKMFKGTMEHSQHVHNSNLRRKFFLDYIVKQALIKQAFRNQTLYKTLST